MAALPLRALWSFRSGAPLPEEVPLEHLFPDSGAEAAEVAEGCAAGAWASARASLSRLWPRPAIMLDERRDVHPLGELPAARCCPPGLKVLSDIIALDEAPKAPIWPDFMLTHWRDAEPSLNGALVMVEVKLPGLLHTAVQQAATYLRRRIFELSTESNNRNGSMHGIFAYAVATDGNSLVLLRITSGLRPPLGMQQMHLWPAQRQRCWQCSRGSPEGLAFLAG